MGLFDLFKKPSVELPESVPSDEVDLVASLMASIQAKISQADLFWKAYAQEKDYFLKAAPREAVEQTNAMLKTYMPGIYGEYEQSTQGQLNRLVLSADGVLEHFNDLMILVQNAPDLAGMTVSAFRQRTQATEFGISMDDFSLQTSDILVRPAPQGGRIALEMAWTKPIDPSMLEHAKHMSIIMMDHILGEYDAVVKVCSLDFAEIPLTPGKHSGWVPLSHLPGVFDEIWKTQLGHTQVFPAGEESWLSFEVTHPEDEDDVMIGSLNASAKSVACRADMGVRLDVSVDVPEKETIEQVYAYEEALNVRLKPQQLGLHVLSLFPLQQRVRTMTWYVFDEPTALQMAVEAAQQFPDLRIALETTYDPRWDSYLAWGSDQG